MAPSESATEMKHKTHEMKSWRQFFEAIIAGEKRHEIRGLDRDFQVGDLVLLREYDETANEYTGRHAHVEITYVTSASHPCALSSAALHSDFCILSIRLVDRGDLNDKDVCPASGSCASPD